MANVKAGNRKRAIAAQKKNTTERAAAVKNMKAAYLAEKDNPVVVDIIAKANKFIAYHSKMAKDGVGFQTTGEQNDDGTDKLKTVFFTNEKRITELDKAAGLEELLAYIERQYEIKPQ